MEEQHHDNGQLPQAPAYNPAHDHHHQQKGSGMAVAGMVCGILSLVLFWVWFLAVPLGVLGIVFGLMSKNNPNGKGMAIAGLVTGIIGTVISILVIVWAVWFTNKVSNDLRDLDSRTPSSLYYQTD